MAKAKMYDAMVFEQDESNLSDAILFATHHIMEGAGPKVGKSIFVFSDGYPSAPMRLKKSLSFAENAGVQTVAVGIGYFTEGISKYFPHFVLSSNPMAFPSALQSFYLGEPKLEGLSEAVGSVVAEQVIYNKEQLENMDEGWRIKIDNVYQKELERTRKEFRMVTYNAYTNQLKINLCFVLDSTGSMKSYIETAKSKIQTITNNIKAYLDTHCGRSSNLQVGFVTYKVRGNTGHLNSIAFTDNLDDLQAYVDGQQSSGGRGNEDKEDGILEALKFNWSGTIKFMVLIGDKPDHGTVGTMDSTIRSMAKQNIYILYVSIKSYTDAERDWLRNVYKGTMESKIKDTGFMEIDMKDVGTTGNTDKLSEKIVDKVGTVIINDFM